MVDFDSRNLNLVKGSEDDAPRLDATNEDSIDVDILITVRPLTGI